MKRFWCTLVVAIGLLAPDGLQASDTASRPPHVFTATATSPVPLLRRWRPDVQAWSLAEQVAAQARWIARHTPSAFAAGNATISVARDGVHAALSVPAVAYGRPELPFRAREGQLRWPMPVEMMAAPFGDRARGRAGLVDRHTGLSFVPRWDSPMRAVAQGVVVYAGQIAGMGGVVIVDHGDLYHTVYAGLRDFVVARGEAVVERDPIGHCGGGVADHADEVYFEIRDRGVPVDPRPWLR